MYRALNHKYPLSLGYTSRNKLFQKFVTLDVEVTISRDEVS
jgi:hypothetical protein